MPADRFYVKSPLADGQRIRIEGTEFHHLAHVMRGVAGDPVEIVNGCGLLAEGTVHAIEKKYATVDISKVVEQQSAPVHQVILAQAIPRSNRLDFILEKGTELGMTQLWLFPGAHSERKTVSDNQIERMESVIIAAMKQSGRLDLPLLKVLPELKKWPPLPYPAFFGDLSPSAPSFEKCWKANTPKEGTIIFIGPESGFNEPETAILRTLGAQGVKLHQNVLRTDTAAIAALALISHWLL